MKVTVAINNYNYARFLGEAIESALSQSHEDVEVIVVDDGSTDNSRKVIEAYPGHVIPVFKDNGGQASAVNAGFEASSGEVVIFLDADDVLLPETAERVVREFEANPGTAKVQYRLRVTDAAKSPTGKLIPAAHLRISNGDLRPYILRFYSYPRSPMSGNAFAASVLREILSVPEGIYRINADLYLSDLAPMYGPVISLGEPGALYRIHGKNQFRSIRFVNLEKTRRDLIQEAYNRGEQRRLFRELYSIEVREVGAWDVFNLVPRVISLKLDPENHPFDEALLSLCVRGCISAAIHPDLRWYAKTLHVPWFIAMFVTPKTFARPLAEKTLYPEKRGRLLGSLISVIQGKAVNGEGRRRPCTCAENGEA